MERVVVPPEINYVAAFITFSCGYGCRYCINKQGDKLIQRKSMPQGNWIAGINRLSLKSDLPVTIQGGEPTRHPDFYKIINGIDHRINIDLLTNLDFDPKEFMHWIHPSRLNRTAKYASIRISYHHEQTDFVPFMEKVQQLKRAGFNIGVFEIMRPEMQEQTLYRKGIAESLGIDWRVKEFLGPWKGRLHGSFKYQGAVNSHSLCHCKCRTSEILIDPSGFIFRCHSDLYANRNPIAHLLDESLGNINFREWRECNLYGKCNACDIKIKTNRFQVYGHSSVEIKNVSKAYTVTTTTERE